MRIFAVIVLFALGCTAFAQQKRTALPNIIFILTDDQRADAMGCAGNPIIQTPQMDKLAADGVRFENAFVTTSICMTSRASILTGLYATSHGIERFDQPLTPEQFAKSYPALLRKAGYHTGFVGKYGLGGSLPADEFDVFWAFPGQGHYFPQGEESGVHLTGVLGSQAVDFIATAPKNKPFCLSISFKAPHAQDADPRQFLYDPALEYLYADVVIPQPHLADERFFNVLPEFIKTSEARKRWYKRFATPAMYQQMVKAYYRLVSGVDREIGDIRSALADHGFEKNTVLVFTSDNGFYLGERGLAGKWFLHEESIRVPLIIHDPRLPKRKRGATLAQPVLNLDIAPTLLEFGGVAPPTFMQGRSLLALIENPTSEWRTSFYMEHRFASTGSTVSIPGSEGVRTRDWKYFRYLDREPLVEECYHLSKDPGEVFNFAGNNTETAKLRGLWQLWKDALAQWEPSPGFVWQDPSSSI